MVRIEYYNFVACKEEFNINKMYKNPIIWFSKWYGKERVKDYFDKI